jgi:hypothetical protein
LYFVSSRFLVAAYLANAVIALVIYRQMSQKREIVLLNEKAESRALAVMYALFLLPVFIQLGSGIFRESAFLFDSGGSITQLPLPVSVLACGLGYYFLRGLGHARFSLTLIFFAFITLVSAGIGSTVEQPSNQFGKLFLAMQFLLPMFAMPVGQLAGRTEASLQLMTSSFLFVLTLVVPAQLAATWLKGGILLQPYLGLFSVYQHLQYVPIVFVSAYLLCLFMLWAKPVDRMILIVGGPVMGVYIILSGSLLGAAGLVGGLLAHAFSQRRTTLYYPAIALFIGTIVIISSSFLFESHLHYKVVGAGEEVGLVAPSNMVDRIAIWKHYSESALGSVSTFIMGSPNLADRAIYPSAHNYFLDLLYNFGLLGLAPVSVALFLTLKIIIEKWSVIFQSLELQALVGVVMVLVVVDNCFKVGLRQPYPGLFSFFLWGVLLSKLQMISSSTPLIRRETE